MKFYDRYLIMKSNLDIMKKIDSNIEESWKHSIFEQKITDLQKEVCILSYFLENEVYKDKEINYSLDSSVFEDFPLSFMSKIIRKFSEESYFLNFDNSLTAEILKFIYRLYSEYEQYNWKNQPGDPIKKDIFESILTMKDVFKSFEKTDIKDCRSIKYPKPTCKYPHYQLLGLTPLFGGVELLKKICKMSYDDAQDSLMFALAQLDRYSDNYIKDMRDILEYWDENQNISFSNGTGMLYQMKLVVEEFKRKKKDLLEDPKILDILVKHKVKY